MMTEHKRPSSRRRRFSRKQTRGVITLTVFFCLVSLVFFLAAFGVEDPIEVIALGIGCLLAAMASFPWLRKIHNFSMTDDGIVLTDSGLEIPWASLTDCRIGGYRVDPAYAGSGPLSVKSDTQEFLLKFSNPQEKSDFYQQVWGHIIENLEPELDPLLAKVFAADQQKHPFVDVIAAGSYGMITGVTIPTRVYLGMFLLAIGSFVGAALTRNPTISISLAVILVILLVAGGLLTLLEKIRRSRSKRPTGGWVMSPSRFALLSKTLSGEMKWSELKTAELKPNGRKPKMIRLRMEGAIVPMLEEYQLPLWYLYRNIELYRSKYASAPVIAETIQPPPRVPGPIDTSNPYSPPSIP